MKAKGETEEDMQTVTLTKKQCIAKVLYMRMDKIIKEYRYFD